MMNHSFGNMVSKKYIPSIEEAQIILNYFVCNNFQDFNTWQQIAKTKVEYQYQQYNHNVFVCVATLKWQEKTHATIIQRGQAKNKKDAKKRALKKILQNILCQGLIANGFRQANFMQKIPKRRKSSSDQSDQQSQDVGNSIKTKLRNLIEDNKLPEALQVLAQLGKNRKSCQIMQCWTYGLKFKNLSIIKTILEIIMNNQLKKDNLCVQIEKGQLHDQFNQSLERKQYISDRQVKPLLQEDLTDFIRYFQLQQPLKPCQIIRSANLNVRMIPSEKILSISESPSMQQLSLHFHPIEGRKSFLSKQKKLKQRKFQDLGLPKFEQQTQFLSMKILQEMYNSLLFACYDYNFVQEIIKMLHGIDHIEIQFDKSLRHQLYGKSQKYYLHKKTLLVAQFSYILFEKYKKYSNNVCLQGILANHKPQEDTYLFNYRQEEQMTYKKTSKRNYNQFYQMNQISHLQFVVLVSKTQKNRSFIGKIIQLSQQQFKVYIPFIKKLSENESFTIYKLQNTKIYDKISSAIIKICKKQIALIQQQTYLIWQPPNYPKISVISQLILEWLAIKSNILIVSNNFQNLSNELTNLGFSPLKVVPKIDQKALLKSNIFVSSPSSVCCDSLRNFVLDRVLIDDAHEISELLSVIGIVKGCKKLYLIGDPYFPRVQVSNPYCKRMGLEVSLFERLYNEGYQTETFTSEIQVKYQFRNVMEWANRYLYSNKLLLYGQQKQTPLIKGFPWPSTRYRVCLIHHQFIQNSPQYLHQQSQICSAICAQVVKSGYTSLQQIICSVTNLQDFKYLERSMRQLLHKMRITEAKIIQNKLKSICNLIKSPLSKNSQLSILMLALNFKQVSFRQILAALSYGRRGAIIICDIGLFQQNSDCSNFINWCTQHKLLCRINRQRQNKNDQQ